MESQLPLAGELETPRVKPGWVEAKDSKYFCD